MSYCWLQVNTNTCSDPAFHSGFVKAHIQNKETSKPHTQTPSVAVFCVVLSWLSIKGRSALEGRHLSKCQQLIHHWLNTIRRFAMKHTQRLTNTKAHFYTKVYSARPHSQSSQRADWLANNPYQTTVWYCAGLTIALAHIHTHPYCSFLCFHWFLILYYLTLTQ